MSVLEAELTKALKDTAQLEESNVQLSQQLSDLREKVSSIRWAAEVLSKGSGSGTGGIQMHATVLRFVFVNHFLPLCQWSPTPVLESCCPATFRCIPVPTQLN